MRALIGVSLALLLSACYVAVGINRAGPAYEEAGRINNIAILPAKLPEKIHGAISDAEAARLRSTLPDDTARWLAEGITAETDVWAHADSTKPTSGYYMTVTITHLDVGDEKAADETAQEEGQSRTMLRGFIYNASTGELVAELHLEKSSGWLGEAPHRLDIQDMARDMAAWFKEKRAEK
jgi:hypothetical protein